MEAMDAEGLERLFSTRKGKKRASNASRRSPESAGSSPPGSGPGGPGGPGAAGAKRRAVALLDVRRAQNISIMLSKFRSFSPSFPLPCSLTSGPSLRPSLYHALHIPVLPSATTLSLLPQRPCFPQLSCTIMLSEIRSFPPCFPLSCSPDSGPSLSPSLSLSLCFSVFISLCLCLSFLVFYIMLATTRTIILTPYPPPHHAPLSHHAGFFVCVRAGVRFGRVRFVVCQGGQWTRSRGAVDEIKGASG